MKPHPRIRKTIKWGKWGGAVVTVLLAVVWIGSGWFVGGYSFISDASRIAIEGGELTIDIRKDRSNAPGQGWYAGYFPAGWSWRFDSLNSPIGDCYVIPLWLPVGGCAIGAAGIWLLNARASRRERALRSNLCAKCKYDRAGLAAGAKCPECGSGGASPTKPHPRIRKTIKWGGAAVTVLLVVVCIGTRSWSVVWLGSKYVMFGVAHGCLYVYANTNTNSEADIRVFWGTANTWQIYRQEPGINWFGDWSETVGGFGLPLWPAAASALMVTGLAWRLDTLARRRARIGLCPKCGYDRAGISDLARCPECGHAGSS